LRKRSDLRREVDSLLNETDQTEKFLERPATELTPATFARDEKLTGRLLNQYRIGPLLGRAEWLPCIVRATRGWSAT